MTSVIHPTTRRGATRRLSGRPALLLGAALLPMAMATAAQAQTGETVVLEEGRTPTPVALGTGDDRLVVDISRVNGDTGALDLSGLIVGPLTNAGGNDTVWLRATGTTTHDIVYQNLRSNAAARQYVAADGTPFTGGTVYEASGNDSVLTLQNTSRSTRTPPNSEYTSLRFGPLRLAGDGTIVIDFGVGAGDQPEGAQQAIHVESETSTLSGDGRLDLELRASVGGGIVGAGGLVDVSNANSMRLINSQLRYKSGVGIKGGTADVVIEANSWVGADDEADTTLIESSGRVYNKALMSIGSQAGGGTGPGIGVTLQGGQLYNIFQEHENGTQVVSGGLGRIYGSGAAVYVQGSANYIENAGLLSATTGPTILNAGNMLVTRNVIGNFRVSGSQTGEIEGGIEEGRRIAYRGLHFGTDVVVNSGKITGDVLLGNGQGMFLFTETTNGVNGTIDGGDGLDGYGKSFSASATQTLGNNLLNQGNASGFEMHGIEANGPATTVIVAAAETLDAGLMLIGDGAVTNTAKITVAEDFNPGVWVRDVPTLASGLRFENRGEIRAKSGRGYWDQTGLANFTNGGTIRSEGAEAVYVAFGRFISFAPAQAAASDAEQNPTYHFSNSGLLESAGIDTDAVSLRFGKQATSELLADISNAGTIRHIGATQDVDDDEQYAFAARTGLQRTLGENYRMHATNTGTIEATGRGYSGLLMHGSKIELVNESIIRGFGAASGGVRLSASNDGISPRGSATLTNRGTITGGAGAIGDGEYARIAYGALFDFSAPNPGGAASLVNQGTIEVGGAGVAVGVDGGQNVASAFTLDNRGTIRGGAGHTLDDEVYLLTAQLLAQGKRTLAGAIHTNNSVDTIANRGTIAGSVDLGDLDDTLANYGVLNGVTTLGDGNDIYVTGSGATLTGTVDGGGDDDVIKVDLTGADAKRINASQFKNFEVLTALEGTSGTGAVSIFGNIDRAFLRLRAISLRVDAGDTIASTSGASGYVFWGDETDTESVAIENDGTIAGAIYLGGGDDKIINRGSIANFVETGAGTDAIVNSGTIDGDLRTDEGDDRLELLTGGLIDGNVQMGAGNDVVTNSGTIQGNLGLGDGDDRYVAQSGGLVAGSIDGGEGSDTFVFRLNGNSGSIPGGFSNFESFGAYGPGTLTLALDQDYETIELFESANLSLSDGTGTVGRITGDDSAQEVIVDDADFTGAVALGGGNDTLSLKLAGTLAGALDGGDGTDTLSLDLTAASTIHDLFNFEIVNASGQSPLTLTGALGAGQQVNFDAQDNRFVIATGASFLGTTHGGAGTDTLEINTGTANSRTIVAGQVASFERLIAGGAGTLALNGQSYSFESVDVAGNLSIGDGASLASAGGVNFGAGDNRLTLEGSGAVTSPVDGGDGTDTLAFNLAAGQTRTLGSAGTLGNFEILAASGAGTLSVDRNADYQSVSIEGGHVSIAGGATLTAPVNGGTAADRLTVNAGGALTGSVTLGGGDDIVTNAGTITGDVNLGDGNDRYVAQAGGVVTGSIDGGAGDNIFVFRLEGALGNIPGSVVNFNSFGVYGPGTLTVNLDAGQSYRDLEILEGANLVLAGTNGSVANVIGDASAQSVTIHGNLTGGVSLGGGNDSLSMHVSGLLEGALDGGEGIDTLNLTLDGASSINGMFGFETANITGASPLTLTGNLGADQRINFTGNVDNALIIAAGATFAGTVDGGGGRDLLRVESGDAGSRTVVASQIVSFEDLVSEGAGTLVLTGGDYSFDGIAVHGGNLELGTGTKLGTVHGIVFDATDNRFTVGAGAEVSGTIEGGAGNDTLALVQGPEWARLLSLVQATGFERLEASGNGVLRVDRDATFASGVGLDGGVFEVAAGNILTANVTGGAARETVRVAGRIEGNLDLGGGDDFLTLSGAGAITGTRSGGDGIDTLIFNTGGTAAAPTAFEASSYASFEALNVEGGVVSLTGTGSYAAINVAGGRLIGQAGSVISAASPIEVARGATFGSAGRVNGDILVSGTLSPGASPGTMTVNGNVAFQPGSNLLLEVSPSASDLLNISGTLTIANGATMDITGVLHGTPGNRLDLVVAQGGITGRFTTINKSNDIFGFVVQNGNRLQIQSEFLNDDAYGDNIRASVDYANAVLRDGYGVQAFTAALPVLVDAQGAISQRAFAQLTPEAYGSAIQLGEENSLLLVDGVQGATATRAEEEGLYTFGQFLAGRADVESTGGVHTGAMPARITNRGFFAGLGYGLGGGTQVGAFVGGLDSKQVVNRWLGAKTELNALAGGVFGDARFGGLGVHGLVAFNGGKAETKRDLLVHDGTGKAKYDLSSWVADLGVDYQVRLGAWSIAPKLGVTYVRTERGAAKEQGLGDFSLSVDAGSHSSWFGEAAIAATGSFDLGGARLTPYAQAGVRRMLTDGRVLATGRYTGAGGSITANGIEREDTAVRVALGLGLDLTEGVRLHAGYTGEFAGTKRDSVMGGVAVRF